MATLREIRSRIVGVKSTSKITSAMKMVAAAKMRRAQDGILSVRPYADKLQQTLSLLAATVEDYTEPLMIPHEHVNNIALIVISADRGLCGGFNASILRAALQHLRALKQQYPKAELHVIPVGRRSVDFFVKQPYNIVEKFPFIFTNLNYTTAQAISRLATDGFLIEQFDKVQIIGNEFRSVVKQEIVIRDFLPIAPAEISEEIKNAHTDYIFEPSKEKVLSSLLPKHLNMQVWRSLLESNAAEQAARMMAMDNATTNAKNLIRELTLSYNKARQAAITKEILEIVGGAEALREG